MNGCPSFEELMSYMDGEASPELARRIEEHLESCAKCDRIVRQQRAMERAYRESYRSPSDQAFDRLRRGLGLTGTRNRWFRVGIPLVAAVLALTIGIKLFVHPDGSPGLLDRYEPAPLSRRSAEVSQPAPPEATAGEELEEQRFVVENSETAEEPALQEEMELLATAEESVGPGRGGAPAGVESIHVEAPLSGAADEDLTEMEGQTANGRERTGRLDDLTADRVVDGVAGGAGSTGMGGVYFEDVNRELGSADSADSETEPVEESVGFAQQSVEAEASSVYSVSRVNEDSGLESVAEPSVSDSLWSPDKSLAAALGDSAITLVFDSLGVPRPDDRLDSLFPGWRVSMESLYVDTCIRMDPARIRLILEEGVD
ncbi:hypothetical protein GF402_04730 [Candidatus Fermentibacteria bacterium]|nr:hypothetical protein [Candidatus Fermentibacteria bacterium]